MNTEIEKKKKSLKSLLRNKIKDKVEDIKRVSNFKDDIGIQQKAFEDKKILDEELMKDCKIEPKKRSQVDLNPLIKQVNEDRKKDKMKLETKIQEDANKVALMVLGNNGSAIDDWYMTGKLKPRKVKVGMLGGPTVFLNRDPMTGNVNAFSNKRYMTDHRKTGIMMEQGKLVPYLKYGFADEKTGILLQKQVGLPENYELMAHDPRGDHCGHPFMRYVDDNFHCRL
jgi:hypothetical protein